jgi:hypothetical protein
MSPVNSQPHFVFILKITSLICRSKVTMVDKDIIYGEAFYKTDETIIVEVK